MEQKQHSTSPVSLNPFFLWLKSATTLAIYGAGTNYSITIDPSSSQPYTETITNKNSTGRNLLYSSDRLFVGRHSVEVVNNGRGDLTLDLFVTAAELGAQG
jgi:hypothetical protein